MKGGPLAEVRFWEEEALHSSLRPVEHSIQEHPHLRSCSANPNASVQAAGAFFWGWPGDRAPALPRDRRDASGVGGAAGACAAAGCRRGLAAPAQSVAAEWGGTRAGRGRGPRRRQGGPGERRRGVGCCPEAGLNGFGPRHRASSPPGPIPEPASERGGAAR